jgi:hypothetical protein
MLNFLHEKPHIQGLLNLFHTVINLTYVRSYKEIARERPDETPCRFGEGEGNQQPFYVLHFFCTDCNIISQNFLMQCYNNVITLHLKNVVETEFIFYFCINF